VHYAGAAHRDDFAWLVVQAFLSHPARCEADLRRMAHATRGDTVSAESLRRHYSTEPGFVAGTNPRLSPLDAARAQHEADWAGRE